MLREFWKKRKERVKQKNQSIRKGNAFICKLSLIDIENKAFLSEHDVMKSEENEQ